MKDKDERSHIDNRAQRLEIETYNSIITDVLGKWRRMGPF